ncbi:glutamate racemase [Bacteroidetes bacterium endosymbiont of Geopemphigus sp.]|uniref:glutamate racemase n=1 Tax=Bacteroidetes bacterium endosymbiont of Geopemphigus sp. TaxID=2047937 RepID=UPI0018A868DA|nr:glutamate racemase [Bacteroidetes bacterium endosymbiont of Geopemphigus sp.]
MINDSSAPIGIFDSGVGGLTIAKAIKNYMPYERLIYFGDTLHFPYGDKSREILEKYSLDISRFLIKEGCKAIVIACNSASSNTFLSLKEAFGDKIPVLNVIDPVVSYISEKNYTKIGLIATRATIKSQVYEKVIKNNRPEVQLCSLATPLLAPMVEEGFVNDKISTAVLRYYLNQETLYGIEALLLGCTHYPIIFEEIDRFYNGKIDIIQAPDLLAKKLHSTLKEEKCLANTNILTEDIFYASALTETFNHNAKLFFSSKIFLKEHHLKF